MQEHDGTRMDTGQQFIKGLLAGGLLVGIPVYISQAPKNGGVAHFAGHLQIAFTVFPLWGTVKI